MQLPKHQSDWTNAALVIAGVTTVAIVVIVALGFYLQITNMEFGCITVATLSC